MTNRYSEDEAIAHVSRLTRSRLTSFVDADMISPLLSESGPIYRKVDLVRMELLCDLCDDFDLHEDALAVVISLIDQLHDARGQLRDVLHAVQSEPPDVQHRIAYVLKRTALDL